MTFRSFRRGYERFLEWVCIALMAALAAEVTAGVVFRYSGHSLVWYDEIASILLAWVTFYGSALAVLKHAHMGVPEIVRMLPIVQWLSVPHFTGLKQKRIAAPLFGKRVETHH